MRVLVSNGFYIKVYLHDQFYLDGQYYGLSSMGRILENNE